MPSVFVFQADLLCEDCGEEARRELNAAGKKPENAQNEATFDSDDYPKGPYSGANTEVDCPQHCHECSEYLRTPLTAQGRDYVMDKIRAFCVARIAGSRYAGDADVLKLWAEDLSENYLPRIEDRTVLDLFLDGVRARR